MFTCVGVAEIPQQADTLLANYWSVCDDVMRMRRKTFCVAHPRMGDEDSLG